MLSAKFGKSVFLQFEFFLPMAFLYVDVAVSAICWFNVNLHSEWKHWDLCGLRPHKQSV